MALFRRKEFWASGLRFRVRGGRRNGMGRGLGRFFVVWGLAGMGRSGYATVPRAGFAVLAEEQVRGGDWGLEAGGAGCEKWKKGKRERGEYEDRQELRERRVA